MGEQAFSPTTNQCSQGIRRKGGEGDWIRLFFFQPPFFLVDVREKNKGPRSPRSPHREIAVRAGVLVGEQGRSPGASPIDGGAHRDEGGADDVARLPDRSAQHPGVAIGPVQAFCRAHSLMLPSPVFGRLSDWIGPVCWLWALPPQPSSIQDPLEGGRHPDALAFRIWMVKSFSSFCDVIELLDHGIRAKFWARIESHVAPEACRPLL